MIFKSIDVTVSLPFKISSHLAENIINKQNPDLHNAEYSRSWYTDPSFFCFFFLLSELFMNGAPKLYIIYLKVVKTYLTRKTSSSGKTHLLKIGNKTIVIIQIKFL